MSTINKLIRDKTHEGAPAPRIDVVSQLERSVMSCLLWEDSYYENGVSIANRLKELATQVPSHELARIAIQAHQDMRLRHVPLFLARQLALTKEGRVHLKNVLPKLFSRPDQITEFLALYWSEGKKPLAKQVKLLIGEAFRKFDEYALQKYNGGQKAVKLRDVMRITRPKPIDDAQAALWGRLIKGELVTPDTWEVAISATTDKKAEWTRLLIENKLGGFAMLRNIRNMRDAGVDPLLITNGINGINAGKLLPINFISAAKHNPQFETQIEKKFLECFTGKEKVAGKTILLIDVSGSMTDPIAGRSELKRLDVACSLGMIAREMFEDVRVFTFSNALVEVPARRGFGLRDAIIGSQPHGGTELGAAVRQVIGLGSRLIVITDEQSHDRVPDPMNAEQRAYMLNVASYQNGVGYGRWLHIDGWSDAVLNYIVQYEKSLDDSGSAT